MNEIGFAPDLIPLVLTGVKTLTYRLGRKDYAAGDRLAVRDTGVAILVTGVQFAPFGQLPTDDSRHETYASRQEMKQVFAGYYGRAIGDDEIMTVVEFTAETPESSRWTGGYPIPTD